MFRFATKLSNILYSEIARPMETGLQEVQLLFAHYVSVRSVCKFTNTYAENPWTNLRWNCYFLSFWKHIALNWRSCNICTSLFYIIWLGKIYTYIKRNLCLKWNRTLMETYLTTNGADFIFREEEATLVVQQYFYGKKMKCPTK